MSDQIGKQPTEKHDASSNASTRYGDRRKRTNGITQGGRRKSDKMSAFPTNRSSRVWFAMSLLLSSIVVAWTFTAPFRSDKPLFAWDKSDLPERAVPISKEILSDPEHAMSDEVFLSHVWQIEDDLQNEFRRRNQVPDDLPDHKEANQAAKETLQSYQQELDVLMKLNSKIEGGFAKGSPEYEAILDVRKRIEQADDLKATK